MLFRPTPFDRSRCDNTARPIIRALRPLSAGPEPARTPIAKHNATVSGSTFAPLTFRSLLLRPPEETGGGTVAVLCLNLPPKYR